MGKNSDATIIIIVLFLMMGFAWDGVKDAAKNGNAPTNSWGGSSVGTAEIVDNNEKSEQEIISDLKESERKIAELKKQAEENEAAKTRSIYYGKFYLSYPSYLNDPNPSHEYFTLSTNFRDNEKVNITGWTLKSERSGNSAVIGRGATLPFPYVKGNEPIELGEGDTVYIVKGFSPIGTSFRTNKCSGYLAEHRDFYPYLSRTCPNPKDEDLPQFSEVLDRDDECRDIIERLPICTVPTRISKLPDTVSSACKTYLSTQINYNTCVANHRSDINFPGSEWFVYLNRFGPLWRSKREHIKLLDSAGKLVAEVKYEY